MMHLGAVGSGILFRLCIPLSTICAVYVGYLSN